MVFVAHRTRLPAPRCHVGPNGQGPRVAGYDAKLTWYRSFYGRKPVTDYLEKSLTTFFTEFPPAWNKVLEVKPEGTSTTAEARRATAQLKPSGLGDPSTPLDIPIQD